MTTLEKLNQLYSAARLANLNAEQHDFIRKLAQELAEELKPKEQAEE